MNEAREGTKGTNCKVVAQGREQGFFVQENPNHCMEELFENQKECVDEGIVLKWIAVKLGRRERLLITIVNHSHGSFFVCLFFINFYTSGNSKNTILRAKVGRKTEESKINSSLIHLY